MRFHKIFTSFYNILLHSYNSCVRNLTCVEIEPVSKCVFRQDELEIKQKLVLKTTQIYVENTQIFATQTFPT
jgi:hypothetical protein